MSILIEASRDWSGEDNPEERLRMSADLRDLFEVQACFKKKDGEDTADSANRFLKGLFTGRDGADTAEAIQENMRGQFLKETFPRPARPLFDFFSTDFDHIQYIPGLNPDLINLSFREGVGKLFNSNTIHFKRWLMREGVSSLKTYNNFQQDMIDLGYESYLNFLQRIGWGLTDLSINPCHRHQITILDIVPVKKHDVTSIYEAQAQGWSFYSSDYCLSKDNVALSLGRMALYKLFGFALDAREKPIIPQNQKPSADAMSASVFLQSPKFPQVFLEVSHSHNASNRLFKELVAAREAIHLAPKRPRL